MIEPMRWSCQAVRLWLVLRLMIKCAHWILILASCDGPFLPKALFVSRRRSGEEVVVFGSDDGFVYGVDLSTGKLRWKNRPEQLGPRRLPGNGRIISERPIRSGVLIDSEGTGYFTAGIFPKQGAYFCSCDVRTGQILDHAEIQKSIQGYLRRQDGQLFAPTGRDPRGATLPGSAPSKRPEVNRDLGDEGFVQIADAEHVFVGGEDRVLAKSKAGEEIWRSAVQGRVYAMAIAGGRLFASTDQGLLYAFQAASTEKPAPTSVAIPHDRKPVDDWPSGYVLYIDPATEDLLNELVQSKMRRIAVVNTEERASAIRSVLVQQQMEDRVVVHVHGSFDNLPYADRIFDRIIGGKSAEIKQLLSPGGTAHCTDGTFQVKASGSEGQWTHAYGNAGNTASSEAQVGSNLQLQWFGGPGPRKMVDRHMRTMPSLASGEQNVCSRTGSLDHAQRVQRWGNLGIGAAWVHSDWHPQGLRVVGGG